MLQEPKRYGSTAKTLAGKTVVYAADGDHRGGDAAVESLLSVGADVVAVSASRDHLNRLLARLETPRRAAGLTTILADLSDPTPPAQLLQEIATRGSRLHAVIANLGSAHVGSPLTCADQSDWLELTRSLNASAMLARTMVPVLRRTVDSLFLFLNDAAAFHPTPACGIMATAAAGKLMLANTLANETQGKPIVHSLIVSKSYGSSSYDDFLTQENIGEAVVRLLEKPASGRNEVILNSRWREDLGCSTEREILSCL